MFPEDLVKTGQALVDFCKAGDEAGALAALYSDDAVSVEGAAMPDGTREGDGVAAIRSKQDWWNGAHEVHALDVSGPFFHGNDRFAVVFDMDITALETGARSAMREVAEYTVKDGRIVKEEFFYGA